MQSTAIPTRIQLPFAASAGGTLSRVVPVPSQIGVQDGAASFTTGFPPLNFQPVASGGVPPFGADFNGLMNVVTAWSRWQAAGAPIPWNSAFSAAIGGYPLGAVVASATTFGILWISTVEDNTSNPDAGGANWSPFSFFGVPTTGDIKLTIKTVADPGWALINADPFSFGNAVSGATFAAASASALYSLIWTGVSNSFAPVSSGRGATPAGDFAANKTIAFPRVLGRALAVAGAGSLLTARALGQFLGEETHLQTLAELVAHAHTYVDPGHIHGISPQTLTSGGTNLQGAAALGNFGTPGAAATQAAVTGITISNSGGGTSFNVMQPTTFLNLMVKL